MLFKYKHPHTFDKNKSKFFFERAHHLLVRRFSIFKIILGYTLDKTLDNTGRLAEKPTFDISGVRIYSSVFYKNLTEILPTRSIRFVSFILYVTNIHCT